MNKEEQKNKDEFLKWFQERDFKGFYLYVWPYGTTENAQAMVDSHVPIVRANWGKHTYRPYVKRLVELKKAWQKQNKKKS